MGTASDNKGLQIHVLGPLSAEVSGRVVDLGGMRQRRVLVALAIDAPAEVAMERLVERVWSESDRPVRADHAVRTYVSRLRRVLAPHNDAISTTERGYRLDLDVIDLDSVRFANIVTGAASENGSGDGETISQALGLWSGQPFGQFGELGWALVDRERLTKLHTKAREKYWQHQIESGGHGEAIDEITATLADHPYHDKPRRLLMLGLFRDGRASEALDVYQQYRRLLAEELGLEPGPELKDLERRILDNDPDLLASPPQHRLKSYELIERVRHGGWRVGLARPPTECGA